MCIYIYIYIYVYVYVKISMGCWDLFLVPSLVVVFFLLFFFRTPASCINKEILWPRVAACPSCRLLVGESAVAGADTVTAIDSTCSAADAHQILSGTFGYMCRVVERQTWININKKSDLWQAICQCNERFTFIVLTGDVL